MHHEAEYSSKNKKSLTFIIINARITKVVETTSL